MSKEKFQLYNLINAARRNAIWSSQGQNPHATDMHIGTTIHLIEVALSILKEQITSIHSK